MTNPATVEIDMAPLRGTSVKRFRPRGNGLETDTAISNSESEQESPKDKRHKKPNTKANIIAQQVINLQKKLTAK